MLAVVRQSVVHLCGEMGLEIVQDGPMEPVVFYKVCIQGEQLINS